MLSSFEPIAFIATTDLSRARTFYETVLGLSLLKEDPATLVFNVNGKMLRITHVPALAPAMHTVFGWNVSDIHFVVAGLAQKGVSFARYEGLPQDAAGVVTFPNGDKVAWFGDLDGNVLSLTQFA